MTIKLKQCRGRLHLNGDAIIKYVGEHNHAGDASKTPVLMALQALRERAATTQEPTQTIIAETTTNIPDSSSAQLPSKSCLKRTIQRKRNQHANCPPQPSDLLSLNIPVEYTFLPNGTDFLLHDSGPGHNRILIFSTRHNLTLLAQCSKWYADGTFKISPNIFQQVYTIHGRVFGKQIFPLVYCLLPNKTFATYKGMLQAVKELQPGLNSSCLMTDFEKGAIRAFQEEFPGVHCTGCFFHLSQSVWRRIQAAGLQHDYQTDPDFASWLRCIPALAFLPPGDVEKAFDDLLSAEGFDPRAQDIANYFEDTYIGRPNRRGNRQSPLFPLDLWNVHLRTVEDEDRTNNQIEGFHRGFQSLIGAQVPNVFRFIEVLGKQQMLKETEVQQLIGGHEPPPKRKKYQCCDERIKSILKNIGERTNCQALKGISFCYNF